EHPIDQRVDAAVGGIETVEAQRAADAAHALPVLADHLPAGCGMVEPVRAGALLGGRQAVTDEGAHGIAVRWRGPVGDVALDAFDEETAKHRHDAQQPRHAGGDGTVRGRRPEPAGQEPEDGQQQLARHLGIATAMIGRHRLAHEIVNRQSVR
ncbi:MAG: hypothetical protein ACK56I_16515, partial [bacterium]